ncbi:hypothetical protein [Kiloniella antarctica]|uniref:Ig-like domain-containing protein n=1 Tax=Kiloniella antarctica TaxID=1550907 RepID=A0ABW5BHF0_9PROT
MGYRRNLKTGIFVLAAFGCVSTAQAQQGFLQNLKKNLENEAADEATKQIKKSLNGSQATVPSTTSQVAVNQPNANGQKVELGTPSKDLTSLTKCTDFQPENITIGTMGEYTFKQGFSNEKRSGLINRKTATLSNGCILPSLQSMQIAYMEVDTKAYEAMGSSNDWEIQCLKSAQPDEGIVGAKEPKTEYPYHVKVLSGKDMMLHCGNSENIAECAEGSNSSRSSAWKKKLKNQGKTMLSVLANTSTLAPAQGEKLYCQYYNKKSTTSLFAFEYLRLKK